MLIFTYVMTIHFMSHINLCQIFRFGEVDFLSWMSKSEITSHISEHGGMECKLEAIKNQGLKTDRNRLSANLAGSAVVP
jgi:hypothetical protein